MSNFGSVTALFVWHKASAIPNFDASIWRHDALGNVIRSTDYGDSNSPYGWEIDHYPIPKSVGGSDHMDNLRPLKCSANRSHGGILGNAIKTKEPTGLLSSFASASGVAIKTEPLKALGNLLGGTLR